MTQVNACTVVTRNRLAHARVLAESFFAHHPGGTLTALLVDDIDREVNGERFEVVHPENTGLDSRELHRMAGIYQPRQLACSLKPWIIRSLLDRDGDVVLYLDSDMQVFDSLGFVLPLAREHSLVLTPHLTEPPAAPPESDVEEGRLIGGTYNAGFLATSEKALPFLSWWSERLARGCVIQPERGYYDDQRWLDLVPGYFDLHVLRDPGCNVAFWNLVTRQLTEVGGRYVLDGAPLRFFHFGGFEPERPHVITRWLTRSSAVLLSERPALARLCQAYADLLYNHGHAESDRVPYAFGRLDNGLDLDDRMRHLYRTALLAFEQGSEPEPPNPFAASEHFVRWLNEPADRRGPLRRVSRYLLALHADRPDLQAVFPDLLADADGFLQWATTEGPGAGLPPELVPPPRGERPGPAGRPPPTKLRPGINVVLRADGERPLDEIGHRLVRALEQASIPHAVIAWTPEADAVEPAAPFFSSLVCLSPIDLVSFAFGVSADFFADRHSAGLWLEPEVRAPDLGHTLSFLDEVWVTSELAAQSLRALTAKRVEVVPVPIEPLDHEFGRRRELGLPEGFLFLAIADFGSPFAPGALERANPIAAVEAFRRAFPQEDKASLLVRTLNGPERLDELERLRLTGDRPDVEIRDGPMTSAERRALVASCDCFVSLHRTLELDLASLESMACGLPLVVTRFGGNFEAMDDRFAYLVRASVGPMPEKYASYWSGGQWAEPDLAEAARLLRLVLDHPEDAARTGMRARELVRDRHSLEAAAAYLSSWHEELRDRKDRLAPVEQIGRESRQSIGRAVAYLSQGPENSWDAPSRLGVPGRLARWTVRRAMRPYTARRRELDEAVVGALAELAERQDTLAIRLRDPEGPGDHPVTH